MVNQNRQNLSVDRIVDLDGIPTQVINEEHYDYLLEDDYLVPEAILLSDQEITSFKIAAGNAYSMFSECLDQIISKGDWDFLGIPEKMADLITFSWNNKHKHILGRFDFAGGIDDDSYPRLLEYNADMPTMIPESSIIQEAFRHLYSKEVRQFNNLENDLQSSFDRLGDQMQESHHSILFTSLGHEEDIANLKPIMQAAERAGFEVTYSDLEYIEFAADEGIFLENDDGESEQFDYLYKLVPWEFIVHEEPDLLDLIHNLVVNDLIYVMNPAYTYVFQSKAFLAYVYNRFPDSPYLLETYSNKDVFTGRSFVQKVTFGRLGENIKIYDKSGNVIENNKGDYGDFPKVYQEFTNLYRDDDGDVYQAGVYTVNGIPSCLSFRRSDKLIIDDDAEFIPHLIYT